MDRVMCYGYSKIRLEKISMDRLTLQKAVFVGLRMNLYRTNILNNLAMHSIHILTLIFRGIQPSSLSINW